MPSHCNLRNQAQTRAYAHESLSSADQQGDSKRVIVMKGSGEKAFCAGGDIRAIYDGKKEGKSVNELTAFFKSEYVLNQLIGNLPESIPHVALLNGITMGVPSFAQFVACLLACLWQHFNQTLARHARGRTRAHKQAGMCVVPLAGGWEAAREEPAR